MTEEATQRRKIKISNKIIRLEDDIRAFDSTLDRIQKLMPEDISVYDRVSEVRDAIFRLQQAMRGCEVVEFASSGLDDMTYQATLNELFWDKNKQQAYGDEGMEEEEF